MLLACYLSSWEASGGERVIIRGYGAQLSACAPSMHRTKMWSAPGPDDAAALISIGNVMKLQVKSNHITNRNF